MLLAGLAYVLSFGSCMPFVDDWLVVPYVSGERSVTLDWLWEQNAQNRHPPSKAVLVGLAKIAGGNFRVVPLLNLIVVGALALGLIRAAAHLRGRISFVDAFFPLMFLSWGLRPYLLLTSDIVFHTWTTALALILLVIAARRGTALTFRSGLLAGVCLLLLTLTKGILYTPPLALWLGVSGYRLRGSLKWKGTLLVVLAATAALLVPLYFVGFDFDNPYGLAPDPSLREQFRVGLGFLAAGFAMRTVLWQHLGTVVLVLLLGGCALLVGATRRSAARDRSRAQALLLYTAGVLAVVLAVAMGREAMGVGHSVRYHLLAMPVLCLIYLAWGLHRRHIVAFAAQLVLFACMAVATVGTIGAGIDFGSTHRARLQAFEQDIRNGIPIHKLVARHKRDMLYWGTHQDLADYLRMLRRAGIEPFAELVEDPAFREVPLAGVPDEKTIVRGSGSDSKLEFRVSPPMRVAGIRLLCSHSDPGGAYLEAVVERVGRGNRPAGTANHLLMGFAGERRVCGPLGAAPQPVDIWIDDRIRGFRIHPDRKPFTFEISEIRLLVE